MPQIPPKRSRGGDYLSSSALLCHPPHPPPLFTHHFKALRRSESSFEDSEKENQFSLSTPSAGRDGRSLSFSPRGFGHLCPGLHAALLQSPLTSSQYADVASAIVWPRVRKLHTQSTRTRPVPGCARWVTNGGQASSGR